jgi:hypothetical protein
MWNDCDETACSPAATTAHTSPDSDHGSCDTASSSAGVSAATAASQLAPSPAFATFTANDFAPPDASRLVRLVRDQHAIGCRECLPREVVAAVDTVLDVACAVVRALGAARVSGDGAEEQSGEGRDDHEMTVQTNESGR